MKYLGFASALPLLLSAGCGEKPGGAGTAASASASSDASGLAEGTEAIAVGEGRDICEGPAPGGRRVPFEPAGPKDFRLTSTGEEPRVELRYELVRGRRARLTKSLPNSNVALTLDARTRCVSESSALIQLEPFGTGRELGYLVAMEISARGETLGGFLYLPDELKILPAAAAADHPAEVMMLPEEAVGVGATWELTVSSGGAPDTATYEVIEIGKDAVKLEMSIASSGGGVSPTTEFSLRFDQLFASSETGFGTGDNRKVLSRAEAKTVETACPMKGCLESGLCRQTSEGCVPEGHPDCWFADVCKRDGRCRSDGKACVVSSD